MLTVSVSADSVAPRSRWFINIFLEEVSLQIWTLVQPYNSLRTSPLALASCLSSTLSAIASCRRMVGHSFKRSVGCASLVVPSSVISTMRGCLAGLAMGTRQVSCWVIPWSCRSYGKKPYLMSVSFSKDNINWALSLRDSEGLPCATNTWQSHVYTWQSFCRVLHSA